MAALYFMLRKGTGYSLFCCSFKDTAYTLGLYLTLRFVVPPAFPCTRP